MSEPVVAQFFGGPWDGEVRELPRMHPTIAVALMPPRRSEASDDEPVVPGTGQYVLAEHTRFGDPWRYLWCPPHKR